MDLRRGSALDRYVLMVSGAGLVALLAAAATAGALTAPAIHRLLLAFALLVVALLTRVTVRVGPHHAVLSFSEAGLIAALALVPMPWVLVASAAAVMVMELQVRLPVAKFFFNLAITVLAAALAGLTALGLDRALGGRGVLAGAPLGWRSALALAAGATLFAAVTAVLVSRAISLSTGESLRRVFWRSNRVRLLILAGNVTLALGGLLLVRVSRPEVLLVPVAFLALAFGYRAYVRVRGDRDAWQQMHAASGDLAILEEDGFLRAAAARTRELFSAAAGDLLICPPGESTDAPPTCYRASLVDGAVQVEVGRDAGSGTAHSHLVDLPGPSGPLGQLRLCFPGAARLSDRERMILDTFAGTVAVGLMNARLHAETLRAAQAKEWSADHDELTALANRQLLRGRLEEAIATAWADGSALAVITLDLDHFKQVNDTLGHAAGDQLLVEVARRLAAGTRPTDLVARLAGDTFAVLATGLSDTSPAERVAANL
ncbi:MAG: diguanylate cyclase domain-containing protein, partial [Mycobacteriales bacterium]